MDKIKFITEDGQETVFFVEEQTRVNGCNYLLVSDSDQDEANAYILKETSADADTDATYIMVEDEVEFEAVSGVFAQMMDEVDFR